MTRALMSSGPWDAVDARAIRPSGPRTSSAAPGITPCTNSRSSAGLGYDLTPWRSVASAVPRNTLQSPTPPTTLEQWTEQKALLSIPISATEMAWWDPKWTLIACGTDMEPGLRGRALGRDNVLVLHPVSESTPAAMTASFHVPAGGRPELRIDTASDRKGDYVLKVFINNEPKIEKFIDTKGEWTTVTFDLMPYTNKDIDIRIENAANGWSYEAGYFGAVTVSP